MIREERLYKVKETHFPLCIFGIIFVSLLLIGALHTQIVVLFNIYDDRLDQYLQVALVIAYWILTSALITMYIRRQMKSRLEGMGHLCQWILGK